MAFIPIKRGATYEVDILDKIAAKGRGIARIQDFVVFVKGAVPGQKVKIQITKIKGNYAAAIVVELLAKSPIETEPKCPHFGTCGGCVWQNLTYEKQLDLKQKQVQETLHHLGRIKSPELFSIIPSPKIWEYRNKIEMSFGFGNMWVEKNGVSRVYHDENPCLGFHANEKWEKIVEIQHCYLFSSKIEKILQIFKNVIESGKYSVYNPKTHRGLLRQLILRCTADTEELLVNIVVNTHDPSHNRNSHNRRMPDNNLKYTAQFGELIQSLSKIAGTQGILITESDNVSDAISNPNIQLMWGKACIYEKLGKLKFKISPFSFFQTNTKGAEKLYEKIAEFAGLQGTEKILDLYCGTGAIGLYLADKTSYVYGMDVNESAIMDARENAKLNNINNIEFICGSIEDELRTLQSIIRDCKIDQIIVDPPRAGMHKTIVAALARAGIKKIVYVSCNPATLARDVEKLIASGYVLTKAQPVDMFPHTAHVETVALLMKKEYVEEITPPVEQK